MYKTWITERDGEFDVDIHWNPETPFVDAGGLYGRSYKTRRGAERWVAKHPHWLDLQPGDLPAGLCRQTQQEMVDSAFSTMERNRAAGVSKVHPSILMVLGRMPVGFEPPVVH